METVMDHIMEHEGFPLRHGTNHWRAIPLVGSKHLIEKGVFKQAAYIESSCHMPGLSCCPPIFRMGVDHLERISRRAAEWYCYTRFTGMLGICAVLLTKGSWLVFDANDEVLKELKPFTYSHDCVAFDCTSGPYDDPIRVEIYRKEDHDYKFYE